MYTCIYTKCDFFSFFNAIVLSRKHIVKLFCFSEVVILTFTHGFLESNSAESFRVDEIKITATNNFLITTRKAMFAFEIMALKS